MSLMPMCAIRARTALLLGPGFTRGVEEILDFLGAADTTKTARAERIRQMATLIGSVIVARAVSEGALREENLSAAASVAKPA